MIEESTGPQQKKEPNPTWQRIEHAMKKAGYNNANLFAKDLGLKRSEVLYRIKRGDNSVSRDIAQRIHRLVPSVSVGWLMLGAEQSETMVLAKERIYIEKIMRHEYDAFETGKYTLLLLEK